MKVKPYRSGLAVEATIAYDGIQTPRVFVSNNPKWSATRWSKTAGKQQCVVRISFAALSALENASSALYAASARRRSKQTAKNPMLEIFE